MSQEEILRSIKGWLPYRMTNETIERERERFAKAMVLIAEGKIEEARRVCWWPKNESPPTNHWSHKPIHRCSCGKQSSSGTLGLCGYCQGTTEQTPSLIPRVARESF